MASRPPEELPESLVIGQLRGVKNTVTPERLMLGELEAAVNVDIDDAGQVHRRRGQTLVSAGDFHSLYKTGATCYGVKNGTLGIIRPDYTFSSIVATGADTLSYVMVADILYYSSLSTAGKVVAGVAQAWGELDGAGQWVSPVIVPTDTLGAVVGEYHHSPPRGQLITYYKGRIYIANDRTIWATMLYLYDRVDRSRNFVQLEHEITMLEAVGDGLYVGTTGGLYFLQGTLSDGLKLDHIDSAPVARGSAVWIPSTNIRPQIREDVIPEGEAIVFMTEAGICAGFDGGSVYNLTRSRVVFPGVANAAALYREQDGVSSFVAVVDSGGDPSNKARIGDFVDAEIRRFQGV